MLKKLFTTTMFLMTATAFASDCPCGKCPTCVEVSVEQPEETQTPLCADEGEEQEEALCDASDEQNEELFCNVSEEAEELLACSEPQDIIENAVKG